MKKSKQPSASVTVTVNMTQKQFRLLQIYKQYNRCRDYPSAAKRAFHEGLHYFYGTNTGNPDLPELNDL